MNRTITTICCSCLLGVASLAGAQDKMAKDMTKDMMARMVTTICGPR